MGLEGHIPPATSFLLFGLWWAVSTLVAYSKSLVTKTTFKSSITFDCLIGERFKKAPLGAMLKIVATVFGTAFELWQSIMTNHQHELHRSLDTNMLHHVTMYAFFWLTGVIDVLVYFRLPLPAGSGHVAMSLAFLIEGLVLINHIAGRQSVNKLIHVLLIAVAVVSVVVVLVEMKHRHNVWFPITRSFLMMLQGTWFWQAWYIIAGTVEWRPTNQNLRIIAIYFCWHIGLNVVFLLVIGGIIHCIVGRLYRPGVSKGVDDEHLPQTTPLLNDHTDY